MPKILIATKNPGKAREYRKIFEPKGFEVTTLLDLDADQVPEIDENGNSFVENALIKANALMNVTHATVLADDSGLCVDALNGAPGIHSARYAGDHDDIANRKKLLEALKDVSADKRTAHFHTSIVVVHPDKTPLEVSGEAFGRILDYETGNDGFGYDPLFYSNDLQKSFAEVSIDEKNRVSHRGKAVKKLMAEFDNWWQD